MKIPYMVIVGEKEKQNKNISVRCRKKGDIGVMTLEKFIEKIDNRIRFEEVL
jgi:threonyl-tRNA synthetase